MQPQALKTELESLCSSLKTHRDFIATQLQKTTDFDRAGITNRLREVTQQTLKVTQFLPKIMAAQTAEVSLNGPLSPADAHIWAELNRASFTARTCVNQWPKIEQLVRDQLARKRRPLYRNRDTTEDILLAQLSITNTAIGDLHQILNPTQQTQTARDHGCFADISLPHSVFVEHAHAAQRVLLAKKLNHPTRFLDVGSGSGLKVLAASRLFDRADGLEYDPAYVEISKSLFERAKTDTCRAFQADGLTYTDYDIYDVIYFYRPMRHIEPLQALEEQIISHARPGTLIIAPYALFDSRYETLGCARIDDRLYITATSQSDADALRMQAEFTGVFTTTAPPRGYGIWDPILAASAAMGYGFMETPVAQVHPSFNGTSNDHW